MHKKNQKISLVWIFLLTLSLGSYAQSTGKLKGKITDKQTKEAIPFATIILFSNGIQKHGTTSDFDGMYSIAGIKPGKYDLKVQYLGYQEKSIKNIDVESGISKAIDVQLSASVVDVQELEIVIEEEEAIEEPIMYSPLIMPEGSIREMGTRNINGVAKMTAGTTSSQSKTPQLKGARASGTQMYINGVKVVGTPNFNADLIPTPGSESYAPLKENKYKSPFDNPLSTFSIDVDEASYTNCRRFINQGNLPPKDAVRVEEFINYFDYDYDQPTGEHPFNIYSELGNCPWNKEHKLVHIGIQGKDYKMSDAPAMNLVFLIDVSGSMDSHNKLPWVKESLKVLVDKLRAKDKISIVVYSGSSGMVLEPTSGADKSKIKAKIDELNAAGSTAGGEAMKLAYQLAEKNKVENGINRIIMATDGDFNVGVSSDEAMKKLVEEHRDKGISISVLGFGMGNYKDSKMEIIADHGNGNYFYIDKIEEARKLFGDDIGGTLFTIAKDVKLQVEFNPLLVKEYRLIGYANRVLEDRDFNNDKIDAGDLGAGHTVTAMYELVMIGSEEEEESDIDPLKYQTKNVPNTEYQDEVLTVKFRYKKPEGTKSILMQHVLKNEDVLQNSNAFNFSASVANFGMLLRASDYRGNFNFDKVISLAEDNLKEGDKQRRKEFIELVQSCKKLGGVGLYISNP